MKKIILSAIALSTLLTSMPIHASCFLGYDRKTKSAVAVEDFSNLKGVTLVRSGRNSGYYIVSPGEIGTKALGLQNAPYRDSANVSRNGEGLDAIVFRFDANGKLDGFPMYISQFAPESFYTMKLKALASGHSSLGQVQGLFGDHALRLEKRGNQTLAYLEVPVYDPMTSGS